MRPAHPLPLRISVANPRIRSGRSKTLILVTLAVIVVGLMLSTVAFLTRPGATAALPVPTPNAYGQMVKLGGNVQGVPETSISECDAETLREFLDSNTLILQELQTVLKNDSVVPLDFSTAGSSSVIDGLGELRQVLRLLHASAALAQLEDRHVDAAAGYVNLLTGARKIQPGGLFIHMQIGAAYERIAWPALGELSSQLTAEEKEDVAWQFQSLVPRDTDFAAREKAWATKSVGRIHMFLMQSQVAADSERNLAIMAEVDALEASAMSKLSP